MEKSIDSFGEEYYHDLGDPLPISDIIKALTEIYNKYGNIKVWHWDDGIIKTIKYVEIRKRQLSETEEETVAIISA